MFQDFPVLQIIFVFIVCATITSFCCLAAERLPHQLGWRDNPRKKFTICSPPSQCNYCGKRIKFLYLLPVTCYCFFPDKGKMFSLSSSNSETLSCIRTGWRMWRGLYIHLLW
ncbi:prepilin peptidase [Salmonella enterica subsp. enterica serovar Infantis]